MKKLFLLTLLCCSLIAPAISFPAQGAANEIEDLKKQIRDLQERIAVIEAENEQTSHQLSDLVKISGYADGEYKMTDQPGKNNEFRVHHLALFFEKEISERWKVFSEIEYEDAPSTEKDQGNIFVEVFTLEYNLNRYANFRLGRDLTPAGIWNVEHYPPFVSTQERPQHIRKIFPQSNDGVVFLGSVNTGGVITDYTLYAGNGAGNSGHGDNNANKAVGGRLLFQFPVLKRSEFGLSYYRETDNSETDTRAAGADLRLVWKNLKLQSEYAKGFYDPVSASVYQRTGYYGELDYNWRKWTAVYRYDWYDPSSIVDNDRNTINTIALNYHFTPHIVGKIEQHFVDPQDPSTENYYKTILSVAAYLGE